MMPEHLKQRNNKIEQIKAAGINIYVDSLLTGLT